MQIIGDVRADSTKALPMRLTGTFTGNATITLAPDRSSFADYFLASIDLSLNAESSLRRQNLRQRSELSVRRH